MVIIYPGIHAFENIREATIKLLEEYDEDEEVRRFGKYMIMLRDDFIEFFSDIENINLKDRMIEILDEYRIEV